MKKFIAVMLCLFALAFVIMACDNNNNGDGEATINSSVSDTTTSDTTAEATTAPDNTVTEPAADETKPAVKSDFTYEDEHVGDKMDYSDLT
ncbi:MAG: hypothetical protein ACI3XQ_11235 [Eubacteriales bacterium]